MDKAAADKPGAPTAASLVLGLQRQAGNRAVAQLVQRLTLQKDLPPTDREAARGREGADRAPVAFALGGLPLTAVERLIDEIGAATIRNVVTPRLLLSLMRALDNDTDGVLKLLDHLTEPEITLLRDVEGNYTDAGFARFVKQHPIAVKRAIRADAADPTGPRPREPGMVVVAAAGIADPDDFTLHSHIAYALAHVGGRVQFLAGRHGANLSTLDDDGTLYVVEHGGVGQVGVYGDTKHVLYLVAALVHPTRGLPPGFTGTIKITSCYSGVRSSAMTTDSIVDVVRGGLGAAGRPGISVIGVAGPSITNMEVSSKYPVVDPAHLNSAAYIQDFLLGELGARDLALETRLNLPATDYAKFGSLRATWRTARTSAATLEERVRLAADLSKDFYAEFVQRLEANHLLVDDAAKKVRAKS